MFKWKSDSEVCDIESFFVSLMYSLHSLKKFFPLGEHFFMPSASTQKKLSISRNVCTAGNTNLGQRNFYRNRFLRVVRGTKVAFRMDQAAPPTLSCVFCSRVFVCLFYPYPFQRLSKKRGSR